ncbi:hypothetical protein niasHT_023191 [Heterodera trifolii]|uniref:Uncharacterized protein n=1 Tax=Heterodera trifolii TaxID=157864 RepID=A0ABD2JD76_9BILA
MISNYLKTQLEHEEEHSTRLNERTQNWRQRKQTLSAREKEIVSADMSIMVPSDIKPRLRGTKLAHVTEEERKAIAAEMEQGRDANRTATTEAKRNATRLGQAEAKLNQQIEAEKAYFDAQLEKLETELQFVASLLPKSQ